MYKKMTYKRFFRKAALGCAALLLSAALAASPLSLTGAAPSTLFSYAEEAEEPHEPLQDEYNYAEVFLNGERTGYQACTLKGSVYIKLDDFEEIAPRGSWTIDRAASRIIFEPAHMELMIAGDYVSSFIQENAGSCYAPLKNIPFGEGYSLCVNLNLMSGLTGLSFSTDGGSGIPNSEPTDINEVYIEDGNEDGLARIDGDVPAAGSVAEGSGENLELKDGDLVRVLGYTASFCKVETMSGEICYVAKDAVKRSEGGEREYDFVFSAKNSKPFSDKFNLVWEQVSASGISPLPPDETGGIDVVAPMWHYGRLNGDGAISSYEDRGFVDLAHERGFRVWATFKNNVSDNNAWQTYTSGLLADPAMRDKMTAQLLFYAALYDLDGINIDFEFLQNSDRDGLTAFIETLSDYCGEMGITLSIDTLINEDYNKMYDYERLGALVDYLMVMTYDHHYNGSLYAGSVSPQGWYTSEVEELLEMVPADKLVMGMPFYTRLYPVNEQGQNLGVISGSGERVYTYGMEKIREIVGKTGVTPEWLSEDGQYFLEYVTAEGVRKVCWLEDSRSIANRLSYVYYYDLAGSCCWAYGLEEEGIFDVFEAIYRDGVSPGAFADPY